MEDVIFMYYWGDQLLIQAQIPVNKALEIATEANAREGIHIDLSTFVAFKSVAGEYILPVYSDNIAFDFIQ
jgi:hypothetical protein